MLQSNEYFSGKVKSIGFTSSSTGRASVGVMVEGEYTFGTAAPEEMTVVSGALNVLLPGETEWKVYAAGETFNVLGTVNFICRSQSRRPIFAVTCKRNMPDKPLVALSGKTDALSAVLRRLILPPGF